MFNEDNTIEQMIITRLQQNWWHYIPADELPRKQNEVLVESMVKAALLRLNPEIAEEPSRADQVIYKLRSLINTTREHNIVSQNEKFKKLIFEENSFPFGKDGRMTPIRFFGTMTKEELEKNEYVITNQWIYPKEKGGKRLDIVLLVNGFPLVIGEVKAPVRNAVTWLDGAQDIRDYEKTIPEMFCTNVFNFASEGKTFRYGAINAPFSKWGPWHTPEHKTEGTMKDVELDIADMMTPENIMDIFQFFSLFATDKKKRLYKIVCRYQQFEGANLLIARVKAGYPKKGLIWHFQGSGKSLLMIFAAQKLRMIPELKNPTVVVVDDRISLETQITGDFNAADIPNLDSAGSKDELIKFFKSDLRKILITTIFRFGDVTETLNTRDNIIVMVDEAHRTQEGDLGEKMRLALPNAFFFGLTGTPINRLDKNTFRTFGAIEDKSGYMSRYSFSDSIRDNATLPLNFEPVPIELHVDKEKIDAEFEELAKGLNENEKAELSSRVNMKAIMYNQERIHKVCVHIEKHFRTKIKPNGYKGMVVTYDRECCLKYKQELDILMGAEATTIVMDTNNDKADRYKAYRRDRDQEAAVLDEFRDPNNPLQLIIVTAKLLTGFDAPNCQVMYLDKPLKDHSLLQAICRVNRVADASKTHGLVVDYIGIFDNVARALNFDDQSMQQVITNIEGVKAELPNLVKKCLDYFLGVDRTISGFEGLQAAQSAIPTDEIKDKFAADFRVLSKAWEALSPDICLGPHRNDYIWLANVYESVKPVDNTGALIWAALGQKTMELIQDNITVESATKETEVIELTPELVDYFINNPDITNGKIKKLEIDLLAKIRKYTNDPKFQQLGEKLEELKRQHEQQLITTVEFLKFLLQVSKEAVILEKQYVPEDEIDKGKAVLTELFEGIKNAKTPVIVERIVEDIDNIVKIVRFDGWQNTTTGQKEVRKSLRSIIWIKYKIKDNDVFEKAYEYVEQYY